jgi:glucose-6-phosphate dehydrogenase assembly protein OpcA
MIIEFPNTTTGKISKALVNIREEGGAVALGRVLTLVISTSPGKEEDAISAANEASREHPMRVIVLSIPEESANITNRLDGEVRVGGDAGASEVIILRAYGEAGSDELGLVTGLLLPDTPVVVWWPGATPDEISESALGGIAQRRITDSSAQEDQLSFLKTIAEGYAPGDSDFAWTRLTPWRQQLASVLDQPPFESITSAEVQAADASLSARLLAAWLSLSLDIRVAYTAVTERSDVGSIQRVTLSRASGDIVLERTEPGQARLTQPGQPVHDITLVRRNLRDCLAEELRHLDPDEVYGTVIRDGLSRVDEIS